MDKLVIGIDFGSDSVGGIPRKAPVIMQMLADVFNKKINVLQSDQACAKGSAMYAAVAGGIFDSLQKAQEMMCDGFEACYSEII